MDTEDDPKSTFRAPALEKGLDILELLSDSVDSLTTSEIAERLGRTKNELFRMLQALEGRGYIERLADGKSYAVTNKLFAMGLGRPATRDLVEAAQPVMRRLSDATHQSCHLAVPSGVQIAIISRVSTPVGISVVIPLGYRRSIAHTKSGIVLFAHQRPERQQQWLNLLRKDEEFDEEAAFLSNARQVVKRGYAKGPSRYVQGVTDISAPVFDGDDAIAALTIPFIRKYGMPTTIKQTISLLQDAAAEISESVAMGAESLVSRAT